MNDTLQNTINEKNIDQNEDTFAQKKKTSEIIETFTLPNYKKDIDFIFEQHPELANIGTKEQYAQYIQTIFPESKIKEIVRRNDTSEENVKNTKAPNKAGQYRGRFFGTFEEVQFHGGETKIMFPVLLNIKNPKLFNSSQKLEYFYTEDIENIKKNGFDGIESKKYNTYEPYEYVVFEPEQIHILGSQEDIKQFKNRVNKNTNKKT